MPETESPWLVALDVIVATSSFCLGAWLMWLYMTHQIRLPFLP